MTPPTDNVVRLMAEYTAAKADTQAFDHYMPQESLVDVLLRQVNAADAVIVALDARVKALEAALATYQSAVEEKSNAGLLALVEALYAQGIDDDVLNAAIAKAVIAATETHNRQVAEAEAALTGDGSVSDDGADSGDSGGEG